MRLAPGPDPEDLHRFLRDTGYPFEWPVDVLARYCSSTSIIASDGRVAGHVWFHWVAGADKVLDLHIAVHPEFHGKTLTRRVVVSLLHAVRATGAKTVLARPTTGANADALRRLGFSLHGLFAILPVLPLSPTVPAGIRKGLARLERRSHG